MRISDWSSDVCSSDLMEEYREIVSAHLSDPSPNPLDSIKRLWRIVDSIKDTLEDRRVNPQDDIISMLWKAEIDGQPTTMDDMENYSEVLFIAGLDRSEEHTSELQSLLRISYAVFCLKKKTQIRTK